jgi:hypothetical protein
MTTQEGILQFTTQFHKEANFFPNQPAFKPKESKEIIRERADRFCSDFAEVIPGGQYQETPLLHQIKLSLSSECVTVVKDRKSAEDANDYIRDHLFIKDSSQYCAQHFGYRNFDQDMKWSEIVERWQANVNKTDGESAWTGALHHEIWRAINNIPAQPTDMELTSIADPKRRYVPLLCMMREYPDRRAEFNVYLYLKSD